ncbi:MAG TPA: ribosome maturation factor RimM [Terriglobales bacterium]|nr:ribosome maturation factor RimM [Terriglobales bacterium]
MTPSGQPEFVTIAKIIATQGRRGEVAAVLLTSFPERFAQRERLYALSSDGKHRRELHLEDHWFHKGKVVLKFSGVDDINQAEGWIGSEIQVPSEERVALEDGSVYVSDLIGCAVFDGGREIGRVQDVYFGSGEAPLLVIKGATEYMVPLAAEYIEQMSPAEKRLEMKLPAGMLELDAPLSRDEKERQKKQD